MFVMVIQQTHHEARKWEWGRGKNHCVSFEPTQTTPLILNYVYQLILFNCYQIIICF